MEHPLALAVSNDSRHYEARCINARAMTKRKYRQYLLDLVNEEARLQRANFEVRSKPRDITQAANELFDYMMDHVADLDRVKAEDAKEQP